jgi:hypothetical protein
MTDDLKSLPDTADALEAALSHLRRLIIDNAELRRELQTARTVTRMAGQTQPATADFQQTGPDVTPGTRPQGARRG